MFLLLAGLIGFILLHSLRGYFPRFREKMINSIGLLGFRVAFSVATLLTLWMIGRGLVDARTAPVLVWQPDPVMQDIMLFSMFFVALGFTARWVPGTHIRMRLKQPVLLAIILWAIGHISIAMMLHQFLVFCVILLWSLLSYFRDKNEPVAIAQSWWRDVAAVVMAAVIWYGFAFYAHPILIGVPAVY